MLQCRSFEFVKSSEARCTLHLSTTGRKRILVTEDHSADECPINPASSPSTGASHDIIGESYRAEAVGHRARCHAVRSILLCMGCGENGQHGPTAVSSVFQSLRCTKGARRLAG